MCQFLFEQIIIIITLVNGLFSEEDLDCGATLKKIITIQSKYMRDNFAPALLVIGGLGLVLHYQKLSNLYDGVPLIMAYGPPVCGKSMAVEIAMSVIGEYTSIGGYYHFIVQLSISVDQCELVVITGVYPN